MITIDARRSVAEITQSVPGAARAFERLGIDYCCRGKEALELACESAHLPLELVLNALQQGAYGRAREQVPTEPRQLVHYILERHHAFTREELARLVPLAQKVHRVHGHKRPELAQVLSLILELAEDLLPHMIKEEQVLFPYIERLADGERPTPVFGTVENPIRMMNVEHEQVGALLVDLERLTNHYIPPADSCGSYRALYAGLKELQADIHEHVHLENHVLFPSALLLEKRSH